MLQSIGWSRLGHDLATEQPQKRSNEVSKGEKSEVKGKRVGIKEEFGINIYTVIYL